MDALDIRRTSLLWLAVVCLAAASAVQYARDQYLTPTAADDGLLYVESPSAVKRLALGYDALLADVYWIRTVQYFGGQKLAERARHKHDLVYPLLDITTTLDPFFNIAYRFGSIFVAEGYPRPPGRPDLAIKLLREGFRGESHPVAVSLRHRLRPLLVAARLPWSGGVVQEGERGARFAGMDARARGCDALTRRRSPCCPLFVGADPPLV